MNKIAFTFCFLCVFISVNSQEKVISLSLKEAISLGLENSYNTRAAANDIESAEKVVWETTSTGLPQINASVAYQNFLKQ